MTVKIHPSVDNGVKAGTGILSNSVPPNFVAAGARGRLDSDRHGRSRQGVDAISVALDGLFGRRVVDGRFDVVGIAYSRHVPVLARTAFMVAHARGEQTVWTRYRLTGDI